MSKKLSERLLPSGYGVMLRNPAKGGSMYTRDDSQEIIQAVRALETRVDIAERDAKRFLADAEKNAGIATALENECERLKGDLKKTPVFEDVLMRNQELQAALAQAQQDHAEAEQDYNEVAEKCDELESRLADITPGRCTDEEYDTIIRERDALRAEVEKVRNNWQTMYPAAIRERDALRAELETLQHTVWFKDCALVRSYSERDALCLEAEKHKATAERRLIDMDEYCRERDEARAEVETLRRENYEGWKTTAIEMEKQRNFAQRERDEARAELKEARNAHMLGLDSALAERDAALAKLAAVREWANRQPQFGTLAQKHSKEMLAILDGQKESQSETVSGTAGGRWSANKHVGSSFDSFLEEEGMLETVTREVVLHEFKHHVTGDPLTSVYEAFHYDAAAMEPDGRELARATVTFRIPKPKAPRVGESLRKAIKKAP